jgi:hypothetical protein
MKVMIKSTTNMYANLCNAYLNITFLPVGIYRVGTKAYPADFENEHKIQKGWP